jgi:transcriptional regulator with XRE-family HTH domain
MTLKKAKQSPKKRTPREKRKTKLKKEIGTKMLEIRKSLHYTQDQIVRSFDCGRANYSRIEKGEVFPNPTMLKVLREQHRVSLHWLICNEGKMIKPGEGKDFLAIKSSPDSIEAEEIEKLFFYIDNVPLVKHAVLGFFLEFIGKNKKLIEPDLQKISEERTANDE